MFNNIVPKTIYNFQNVYNNNNVSFSGNVDKNEIFKLKEQGLSTREIAQKLDCSTVTIYRHLPKSNTRRPINYEQIRLLNEQGLSVREIAKRLNCTTQGIYNYLKHNNIKLNWVKPKRGSQINVIPPITNDKNECDLVSLNSKEIEKLYEKSGSETTVISEIISKMLVSLNDIFNNIKNKKIKEEISPVPEQEVIPLPVINKYDNLSKKELQDKLSDFYLCNDTKLEEHNDIREIVLFYTDNPYADFKKESMSGFLSLLDEFNENKIKAGDVMLNPVTQNLIDSKKQYVLIEKENEKISENYSNSIKTLNKLALYDLFNGFSNVNVPLSSPKNREIMKKITDLIKSANNLLPENNLYEINQLEHKLTYYLTVLKNNDKLLSDIEKDFKINTDEENAQTIGQYICTINNYNDYSNGKCNDKVIHSDFYKLLKEDNNISQNEKIKTLIKLNDWFTSPSGKNNELSDFTDEKNGFSDSVTETYINSVYLKNDTKINTLNTSNYSQFISVFPAETKYKIFENIDKQRAKDLYCKFENAMKKTAGPSCENGIKQLIAVGNYQYEVKITGQGYTERLYSTPKTPHVFDTFKKVGYGH